MFGAILFLLLAAFIAFAIVSAIHFFLTSNIHNRVLRTTLVVFISITTYLAVLCLPLALISYVIDDFPVIRKSITSKYYFTQQDFGFVTTLGGKDVYIYQSRPWWFDKKIGDVRLTELTDEVDASVVTKSESQIQLQLKSGNKVLLDTTVFTDKYFDLNVLN